MLYKVMLKSKSLSTLPPRQLHRSLLGLIGAHFLIYIHYYIFGSGCLVALHLIQAEIPLMAKGIAESLNAQSLEKINHLKLILLAGGIIIFRSMSRLLFFYPARLQQRDLRLEVIDQIEKTYPGNYQDLTDGNLYQSIYDDFNRIRGAVGFGLLQVVNVIIAVVVYLPLVLTLEKTLLYCLSPLLVAVIGFSFLVAKFQNLVKKTLDYAGEFQNILIESYNAKETIQNFNVEKSILDKVSQANFNELNTWYRSNFGRIFGVPLVKLGLGVTLLLGSHFLFQSQATSADLIYFSGLLFLILEPFIFISWIGVVISNCLAAWERIQILQKKLNQPLPRNDQDKLDFEYNHWKHQINLSLNLFKHHQFICFAGDTGVGKTTLLLDLVLFLKSKFADQVAYVPQEVLLFNDTIRNNLFLNTFENEESLSLAEKLFNIFALNDLAPTFAEFLKMEVGENGKKVSGGQAKRIYLMRSLISNANFQVWDDPFNSIDVANESKILSFLREEESFKNFCFILSSHRINTFKFMDYYLLINKEGVKEQAEDFKLAIKQKKWIYEHFKDQMV